MRLSLKLVKEELKKQNYGEGLDVEYFAMKYLPEGRDLEDYKKVVQWNLNRKWQAGHIHRDIEDGNRHVYYLHEEEMGDPVIKVKDMDANDINTLIRKVAEFATEIGHQFSKKVPKEMGGTLKSGGGYVTSVRQFLDCLSVNPELIKEAFLEQVSY